MLPPACELWGPCPPEWGSARAPSPQPEPTLLSTGVLAAPGLLQGAWPQSRDPPAPRSRSRDTGQRHQHTPQHFIATAAAGHPSSRRGSGAGPGLGSSPLILLGPLHDSHSPRLLHPGPHGAASRHHSRPDSEPDARPRVLSMPASFPRPSLRGAGGRAPPGCRGGSGHTSMPGARPSPSACTRSSLSPLFSVRRTVGRGDRV